MNIYRVIGGWLMTLVVTGAAPGAENWPNWRGPDRNGVSDATDLPTTWSETENIVWKAPLPAWSGATPIIWGDRIFVTSPVKYGSTPADESLKRKGGNRQPGGEKLLMLCLSKADGKPLWQIDLGGGNMLYRKQNMTSPSPVTDGKHVWVLTGTGVLAGLDMDGNEIWRRNVQEDFGTFGLNWGYASSPVLVDGKLVMQVLHGFLTDDPSYLVAFDPATGKTLWKQERPTDAPKESPDAYTTPAVLRLGDRTELVVTGGDYATGHDLETGKEVWRAGGLNPMGSPWYRIIASPVVTDELIYVPTRKKPFQVFRVGGKGDITTSRLAWRSDLGPDVPTPVTDGRYLYIVDDAGFLTCLDAETGKSHYEKKRFARGTYSASPLLADGKIYVTNESCETTVLAAGPEFKILGTNKLDGGYTLSSFAVSGKRLYLRGATHLYCIGEK